LGGKDRDRSLQFERDGVAVEGIHGGQRAIRSCSSAEPRVQKAPERINDVLGGELAAVVEEDPTAQPRDVREGIRVFQRFRQIRDGTKLIVDPEQGVEDELMGFL
jgi:hypothetical protein